MKKELPVIFWQRVNGALKLNPGPVEIKGVHGCCLIDPFTPFQAVVPFQARIRRYITG